MYRAAVREIRQSERGVWVIYADADGRPRRVDADYCVCTIPLPVLSGTPEGSLTPRSSRPFPHPATMAPARSDCSSSAASGKTTTRSMAAGRGPTTRSGRLSIHRTASRAQRHSRRLLPGFQEDDARAHAGRDASSWRSNKARACTRNTPTEFETAFSVSWPRVPWNRGSWRSETAAAHEALAAAPAT